MEAISIEELVRQYQRPLRRLAGFYANGSNIDEDLLQEIVLALCRALPPYRGDCTIRTWVYRIAHNVAISFIARQRKEHSRLSPLDQVERQASPNPSIHNRALLMAAIRRLAPQDQHLVLLFLEGPSASEIEAVTGLSSANVATRLSRIRKSMTIEVIHKS